MTGTRRQTSPVLAGKYETDIAGRKVEYTVKRSAGARRVRLEIKPGTGLTVTIPRNFSLAKVPEVVKSRSRWIVGALARTVAVNPLPLDRPLQTGDLIPYLGQDLKLVLRPGDNGNCRMTLDRDQLLIDLHPSHHDVLGHLLKRWYRFGATRFIEQRAAAIGRRLKVEYRKVGVRDQRTRWGSCSRNGNLSFNWKLLLAPEEVIDYVIIHELTHLKEMNHSPRFWQLVASRCPRFQEHKRWLREHEGLLAALCA